MQTLSGIAVLFALGFLIFLGWGLYGLLIGDHTITLIFSLVMVLLSIFGFFARRHRREQQAKNEESISEAISLVLNNHKSALSLKAEQLRSRDAYGGLDNAAWEREKKYFIDRYLFPYVGSSVVDQIIISGQIDRFVDSLPKPKRKGTLKVKSGDGIGYEKYCAEKFKENGWDVRLTKASGDQGVDIIATKFSKKVVIQCKNYSKPVGNKAVQEVHSGMIYEKADFAVVVSRKGFTPAARRLANSTDVQLIDDSQIDKLDEIWGIV